MTKLLCVESVERRHLGARRNREPLKHHQQRLRPQRLAETWPRRLGRQTSQRRPRRALRIARCSRRRRARRPRNRAQPHHGRVASIADCGSTRSHALAATCEVFERVCASQRRAAAARPREGAGRSERPQHCSANENRCNSRTCAWHDSDATNSMLRWRSPFAQPHRAHEVDERHAATASRRHQVDAHRLAALEELVRRP